MVTSQYLLHSKLVTANRKFLADPNAFSCTTFQVIHIALKNNNEKKNWNQNRKSGFSHEKVEDRNRGNKQTGTPQSSSNAIVFVPLIK